MNTAGHAEITCINEMRPISHPLSSSSILKAFYMVVVFFGGQMEKGTHYRGGQGRVGDGGGQKIYNPGTLFATKIFGFIESVGNIILTKGFFFLIMVIFFTIYLC